MLNANAHIDIKIDFLEENSPFYLPCRWGPNAKETAAIKKYLETQNVDTRAHPLVGGLEVDLPALYHAVQSFGGLSEVRFVTHKPGNMLYLQRIRYFVVF